MGQQHNRHLPLYFVTTAPFLFNGSPNLNRRELLLDTDSETLVGASGHPETLNDSL